MSSIRNGVHTAVKDRIKLGISLAERLDIKVASVILFGSYARGDFEENVSDIDIIFIVDDATSNTAIYKMRDTLISTVPGRTGILDIILNSVSRQTGMFISGFVCRKSDFLDLQFHKIFGVSKRFAWLFAPRNLVIGSVLSTSKTVFGEDILHLLKPKQTGPLELGKSMLMNLLLAFCSLVISPFSSRAITFSLESLKWCIHTGYFYVYRKNNRLIPSISRLGFHKEYWSTIQRFLKLRRNPTKDPLIAILALWYAIRFHLDIYKKQSP